MWGDLILLNRLSNGVITGHRHMQLDLDMMEKRAKLLAIYGAIPPRVWEEMALQLLRKPPKFHKRVWGI